METTVEDRVAIRELVVRQLIEMPRTDGCAIALGIVVRVLQHHAMSFDRAEVAFRDSWKVFSRG